MLNKRIISAVAAVAVAFGGVGAPVFGGIAQSFDISAFAYSYDYDTFRANCVKRGATDRMIEELDKFFLQNLDYFTPGDFKTFIEKTDWLYENVMLPQSMAKYGKDPSELTDEERRAVVSGMGTQNQMQAYEFIRQVGEKHGVIVGYDLSTGKIDPVCTIVKEKPSRTFINVSVVDADATPDITQAEVSVVGNDGELLYTQNPAEDGSVDVTDLVKNGKTLRVSLAGYAPRDIVYDNTAEEVDATLCKYGDLNGDGLIDSDDLVIMQKKAAGWKVDSQIVYPEVANVDVTGDVDSDDLVLEQKAVAGWKVKLGVPRANDEDTTPVVED